MAKVCALEVRSGQCVGGRQGNGGRIDGPAMQKTARGVQTSCGYWRRETQRGFKNQRAKDGWVSARSVSAFHTTIGGSWLSFTTVISKETFCGEDLARHTISDLLELSTYDGRGRS